jgi:hypothetical protein
MTDAPMVASRMTGNRMRYSGQSHTLIGRCRGIFLDTAKDSKERMEAMKKADGIPGKRQKVTAASGTLRL